MSQQSQSVTISNTTMDAHQLPQDCYPPTDSDDESFVVLHSDCEDDDDMEVKAQLLQSDIIDASLEQATEAILNSLTLQSLPAAPKMDASMGAGSLDSVTTNATNDELQQKIEMLLDENTKLSNSLNQNNIVMKNQYETLAKWQEDVLRVHESHRKKFAETKEYIKQLQKEYAKLKEANMLINTSIISKSELQPKHVEDVATSMDSLKQDAELQNALDQLKIVRAELSKTNDDLKVANENVTAAGVEVQALKDKVIAQENEITALKTQQHPDVAQQLRSELQKSTQETRNAKEEMELMKQMIAHQVMELARLQTKKSSTNEDQTGLTSASAPSQELEAANNEIQQLKAEVNKYKDMHQQLSAEYSILQEHLDSLVPSYNQLRVDVDQRANESVCFQRQYLSSINDVDALKKEIESNQILLNERNLIITHLTEQMNALNDKEAKDKSEIKELKEQLASNAFLGEQLNDYKKQVKANDDEYKKMELENLEGQKKMQKLLEDITVLKCQLAKLRSGETAETQKLRIQLCEAQNIVVQLKEGKKIVEIEAEQNRKTIDDLDKKLKDAITDQDRIVALEQQLQIYRGDFESERENKIRMIEELNKVSDDLSNVHKRNRELIEEIEHLRAQQQAAAESFVEVPMPPSKKTPSPPLSHFPCPLCGEMFRSARAIEEHVDRCLNTEAF